MWSSYQHLKRHRISNFYEKTWSWDNMGYKDWMESDLIKRSGEKKYKVEKEL